MTNRSISALLCVITVVVTSEAKAQTRSGTRPADPVAQAVSFDALGTVVADGDTITIADQSGQKTRGRLAALTPESIDLQIVGERRTFRRNEIISILHDRRDSIVDGVLLGMFLGGAAATLGVRSEEYAILKLAAFAAGGGAGSLVGGLVDASHHRQVLVYQSSGRSARWRVIPSISPAGAAVALRVER